MSVIEKKPIIQSVFSLKTSFELFPFELKCFPLEIQSPFFPSFFLFFLMRDNMITAIFWNDLNLKNYFNNLNQVFLARSWAEVYHLALMRNIMKVQT